MEDLINESYNFEQVDDNQTNIKYDFVSIGLKEVPKRVAIIQYKNAGLERYYNLGFGNLTIDENGTESICDMSRDNNRHDKDKVLKTVFCCTLDFLSVYPDSIITFYGNTSAKHRLYKMGLQKNLNSIKSCFTIKGGIINDLEIAETEGEGKRAISTISIDKIDYELYNPIKSKEYNFITFELIDELK
jgi:hypothetical protein